MGTAFHAFGTARLAIWFLILAGIVYVRQTLTRPPWVGLGLLCLGSIIFEVTLFALMPVPSHILMRDEVRIGIVLLAAAPAIAAVVVAVVSNRRLPIVDFEHPSARLPGMTAPSSRSDRWRDYHN
jgi:hypothetical protein